MTCVHLQQLFQLCRQSEVHVSGADLVRFVCRQCNQEEVCPSMLFEEYDDLKEQRDKNHEAKNSTTADKN